VEGSAGLVPAQIATSLALVLAELVHNAIEHGLAGREAGVVTVEMNRRESGLSLTVTDDGVGFPQGFDPDTAAHLGLAIVGTIVKDDLRGTISFGGQHGAKVTVLFPLEPDDAAAEGEG
ncbi:MAG: ATP-binding protein, partial [Coriobacteriia bacterium]|nr:ATP-binding protein [Coriobacteriia bacterium]